MDPQFQQIEKRIDDFVKTTNIRLDENSGKLDLLIDLAKQMAVIQEKQNHNTDDIRRLEIHINKVVVDTQILVRKTDERLDRTTERMYQKFEEIETTQLILQEKKSAESAVNSEKLTKSVQTLSDNVVILKDDYKEKLNFFRGIFFAVSIFIGAGQFILYKYFGEMEKNISDSRISIQKIENKMNDYERSLSNLVRPQK